MAVQGRLGGDINPPAIKEIEDAAEALRETRQKRMDLQKTEAEQVTKLKELMQKNRKRAYSYIGEDSEGNEKTFDVTIENKAKVSVRVHKDEPQADPDDEGAEE